MKPSKVVGSLRQSVTELDGGSGQLHDLSWPFPTLSTPRTSLHTPFSMCNCNWAASSSFLRLLKPTWASARGIYVAAACFFTSTSVLGILRKLKIPEADIAYLAATVQWVNFDAGWGVWWRRELEEELKGEEFVGVNELGEEEFESLVEVWEKVFWCRLRKVRGKRILAEVGSG